VMTAPDEVHGCWLWIKILARALECCRGPLFGPNSWAQFFPRHV
jgi:hypothetical protein